MKIVLNVLIVDDHPIIIESYTNILRQHINDGSLHSFNIVSATSVDETVALINNNTSLNKFDLVLLDISMPKGNISKMHSGEDLGLYIKSKIPDVKIIAVTALNDTVRLLNILKKLNPEGLLVKSDINGEILIAAIIDVIEGHDYYSHSIIKLLKKRVSQDTILDDFELQLLVELSNGSKMKELQELFPLSRSGIVKRKKILGGKLGVQKGSDRDLVLKARESGFI